MDLPDFFVIGAPKAGTTALHLTLALHPQLFMAPVKEPKFFLCDGRPPRWGGGPGDAHSYGEWIWRQQDYEALFADAPAGTLKGESTPFYLADFAAQRRIRERVPQARLIAILRDPVDRAYSNWAHLWSDGLEPVSDFLAACAEEERRIAAGWAPFWHYLSLGRYGEQLRHLNGVFPREQVHVLRYRHLIDRPREALNGICEFLGVTPDLVTSTPFENVSAYVEPTPANQLLRASIRAGASLGRFFPPRLWRKASTPLLAALRREAGPRPPLTTRLRRQLLAHFTDDIRLLEQETGRSYADWIARAGTLQDEEAEP